MQLFPLLIQGNALKSSDHIPALNRLARTFLKPRPLFFQKPPLHPLALQILVPKSKAPKRILSKEPDNWRDKVKENGNKENVKCKLKPMSQESSRMYQLPSPKDGKRSKKSDITSMKQPHKSFMKWQPLMLNKKPDKQKKISNKELKILRKAQRMFLEMSPEKFNKESMKPKKRQVWNLKRQFMRTLRKALLKVGKMWRKALKTFITKLHKK